MTMFDFGKHEGKSFAEVHQEDPDYLVMWLGFSRRGCDWISDMREKIKDYLREALK